LPHLAHVPEVRDVGGEPLVQPGDLRPEARQGLLVVEEPEAREPDRTGERVSRVRVAVEEGAELLVRREEGLEHLLGGEGRRQRQVAAADSLSEAHEVGRYAGMLAGEHPARASEARRYLVGDEEGALAARELAERAEIRGRMDPHPGSTRDQWLQDDRGEPGLVRRE